MAGPFRIRTFARGETHTVEGAGRTRQVPAPQGGKAPPDGALTEYADRLMRMIPGEVVALYLTGAGVIPDEHKPAALPAWALICLAALVLVRAAGSRDTAGGLGPQWPAVLLSAGAFLVWLYALGGPFAAWGLYVPWLGSLLILAYTFFVPYLYKGEAVAVAKGGT
jgi:hypothetical protein